MKKIVVILLVILGVTSCARKGEVEVSVSAEDPLVVEHNLSLPPERPVEVLSLDGLVGKWLLLDSDGEVASSGDYLLIVKNSIEYSGLLVYQGVTSKCKLATDANNYYVISERGEKYKISRIRSIYINEHNGIGLALDDIDFGSFQREDVLGKN